jgi:hypothetical protein
MELTVRQPTTIIFNAPDGREEANPSRESLRELVLNGGDAFWAAGSGQAALEFSGAEGGRLLLMGLEAEGFLLIYEPTQGHDFCSVNPSETAREQHDVEVHVGGEPMQVPRRQLSRQGDRLACDRRLSARWAAQPEIAVGTLAVIVM